MELAYWMTYRALLEPPRESSARWTQHWSRYSG